MLARVAPRFRWHSPVLVVGCLCLVATIPSPLRADEPAVVQEFVFEQAPFKSCHASTLLETGSGELLCAWFAGDAEGRANVGIWISRKGLGGWSAPFEVITGVQTDGTRYPCWNPVLTRSPSVS